MLRMAGGWTLLALVLVLGPASADEKPAEEKPRLVTQMGFQSATGSGALSPDGRFAASGYDQVLLWDAATGRQLRILQAGQVYGLRFLPDGKHLVVSGLVGNEIRLDLLDVKTGRQIVEFKPYGKQAPLPGPPPQAWLVL